MKPLEQNVMISDSSNESPSPSPNPVSDATLEPGALPSLTQADFQRLGVQPQETRHMVIRRAAVRTTEPVARRFLNQPSAQVARQLTQIATSTYRLLDPRQRTVEAERVHIGRIRPTLLQWAGRTEFARTTDDQLFPTRIAKRKKRKQFEPLPPGDTILDEPITDPANPSERSYNSVEIQIPTGLELAQKNSLTQSLDSGDLVRDDFRRSPLRRFRFWLSQPTTVFAITAVLMVIAGGSVGWMLKRSQTAEEQFSDPETISALTAGPSNATTTANDTSDEPNSSAPKSDVEVISEGSPANPALQFDPVAIARNTGRSTFERGKTIGTWLVDQSGPAGRMLDKSVVAIVENMAESMKNAESRENENTPDPKSPPDPNPSLGDPVHRVVANDTANERKFDVEISAILKVNIAELGSAENRRVAFQGLWLSDHLLCMGELEKFDEVADHTRKICFNSGENDLIDEIKSLQAAKDDMESILEKVEPILGNGEATVSAGDAAIVGRFLCLQRRDWDQGASWLARASDARLASLAKKDHQFSTDGQPAEFVELAERFERVAKRFDGRAADSIRIRAIHWIDEAQRRTKSPDDAVADPLSQLEILESTKLRTQLAALLPNHLQNPPFSTKIRLHDDKVAPGKNENGNAEPLTKIEDSKMNGWVESVGETIDSDNARLTFEYSPGIAINKQHWQQIQQQIGVVGEPLKLQLRGIIDLAADTKVEWVTASLDDSVKQSIVVDNAPLTIPPGVTALTSDLKAGQHRIEWTLTAKDINQAVLAVLDARNRKPIAVRIDPNRKLPLTRGTITLSPQRSPK